MSSLDHQTKISIALVATMMGAAVSFGVMWQKLDGLEKNFDQRLTRIENKLDKSVTTESAGSTLAIYGY